MLAYVNEYAIVLRGERRQEIAFLLPFIRRGLSAHACVCMYVFVCMHVCMWDWGWGGGGL